MAITPDNSSTSRRSSDSSSYDQDSQVQQHIQYSSIVYSEKVSTTDDERTRHRLFSSSTPNILPSSRGISAAEPIYKDNNIRARRTQSECSDYGWFDDAVGEEEASPVAALIASGPQPDQLSIQTLMDSKPSEYQLPKGFIESQRWSLDLSHIQFKHYYRRPRDGSHVTSEGRTFALQMPNIRLVARGWGLTRQTYAEYQIVAAFEGDLYVCWKRHKDFRLLARRAAHFGYPSTKARWAEVRSFQAMGRCVEPQYLRLKAFLLERFLKAYLCDCDSPAEMIEFLVSGGTTECWQQKGVVSQMLEDEELQGEDQQQWLKERSDCQYFEPNDDNGHTQTQHHQESSWKKQPEKETTADVVVEDKEEGLSSTAPFS